MLPRLRCSPFGRCLNVVGPETRPPNRSREGSKSTEQPNTLRRKGSSKRGLIQQGTCATRRTWDRRPLDRTFPQGRGGGTHGRPWQELPSGGTSQWDNRIINKL